MHPIQRYKIIISIVIGFMLILLHINVAQAQMNMQYHDNKKLFFGVTFAYNRSDFKIIHSNEFLYSDSILVVESEKGPGFNLGIVSNFKLIKRLDLRVTPSLSFAERNLLFTTIEDTTINKTIESINLEIPVDLRLKSDRYGNFRVYALLGAKFEYDLNSNAKNRKLKDQIKLDKYDLAISYGGGFSFYFPMFILSPEVKIYQGIFNVHSQNPDLIYARMIDKLLMRTILFTIHIEG